MRVFIIAFIVGFMAVSAHGQTVSQTRAQVPPGTTMMTNVAANSNGTVLQVGGYASAMFSITASVAMSGGTIVNFECQANGTFGAVSALLLGSTTVATTTSAAGDYQINVGSYQTCRTRVSNYSAGTISVTGYPSVVAPSTLIITSSAGGGSAVTLSSGAVASGAYSSGSIASGAVASGAVASGAYASGSIASGAIVDGANVTQGALADAVVAAGAAGSVSAKLRAISRDLVANIVLAAGSNVIGHVIADSGSTTAVTGNVATTVADAANVNQGANADAAVTAGATGTISAKLRAISRDLVANIVLAAGSNVIGHVVADSGSTTAVTGNVTVVQPTASSLNAAVVGTGTAGTAAGGVLTIQGVAAMTKLLVTPDSVALPPNQSVNLAQVAGTNTVNGGVAGSQSVGGTVATNVAITANPLNQGAQAVSSENAAVTTTRQVQLVADLVGKLIVLPYANPENFVSGLTAAMTGTTSTSMVAAPASGLRNYLTHIICTNSHATVGTFIIVQDGSGGTTYYEGYAAAVGGGFSITFPTPLRQPTTATAVYVADVTTGANVICSASGYKGA